MPTVKIQYPSNNSYLSSAQSVTVSGKASDPADQGVIKDVYVQVDNNPPVQAVLVRSSDGQNNIADFTATVTITGAQGAHTITATASDNTDSASDSVTVFLGQPIVETITVDFNSHDDGLNGDSLLHVFVKNRSSDSSTPSGAGTYDANLQSYLEHDTDWFRKNPFLGYAENASKGKEFEGNSTNRVVIQLRSKPIPFDELALPEVHIHILAKASDRWMFDYTLTITLDDGTVLPPFNSNVDGLTGIVLDQDNRNYYGICAEFAPAPAPIKPATDECLTGIAIEFHTHDDNKNDSTTLDIHVVNRVSATESHDIAVASDIAKGEEFPDSGNTYKRLDLPLGSRLHPPAGHGSPGRLHQYRRRH